MNEVVEMEWEGLNGTVKLEVEGVNDYVAIGRAWIERQESNYGKVQTVVDVLHENIVIKNAAETKVIVNTVASDDIIDDETELITEFFEKLDEDIDNYDVEYIAKVAALLDAAGLLSKWTVGNWFFDATVCYINDDGYTFEIGCRMSNSFEERHATLICKEEKFNDVVEMLEAVCNYLVATQQEIDAENF